MNTGLYLKKINFFPNRKTFRKIFLLNIWIKEHALVFKNNIRKSIRSKFKNYPGFCRLKRYSYQFEEIDLDFKTFHKLYKKISTVNKGLKFTHSCITCVMHVKYRLEGDEDEYLLLWICNL